VRPGGALANIVKGGPFLEAARRQPQLVVVVGHQQLLLLVRTPAPHKRRLVWCQQVLLLLE
jgi:hypothetical protein